MLHPLNILVVSSGFWHPGILPRRQLSLALQQIPEMNCQFVPSLEVLPRLEPSLYQGMVLYFHQRSISAAALSVFRAYVTGGGGVLALHSASASFKSAPGYFEILGGRFVRHGPVARYELLPAQQPAGLCADMPPFWVRDELYRHEYNPQVNIHLHTMVDGEREPVLWTHRYGDGRVCYCSLGHTSDALRQTGVQRALQRGLTWAVGLGQPAEAEG